MPQGSAQRRSITPVDPDDAAPAARRPAVRPPAGPPPSYAPRPAEPPQGAGPPLAAHPMEPEPGYEPAPRPRRRRRRPLAVVLVLLLVLLLAWPVGLLVWANGKLNRVDALSAAGTTAGTTYLLAGSDSRDDGAVEDATEGERSDTIMMLHAPSSGPASLISLPRDTFVDIPRHGGNKINAAFALGGPPLLVASVEQLTGLTVDHYVQIGMGGVADVVDAVGRVELCLDYDVDDWRSELVWESGCHEADGATALAFARMRYADPDGDIGRAARQRQLVSAIVDRANDPATLVNPVRQVELLSAGTDALAVDDDTGIINLGRMALAFRKATGADGIVGVPPISDYNYQSGGIGSALLLDPERAPDFFTRMRDGDLTPADVE